MLTGRMGNLRELKSLQIRQEELNVSLEAIQKEKIIWEGEKSRVAKGLVSVHQILNKTLTDLEEVTDFIGADLIESSSQDGSLPEVNTEVASAAPVATSKPVLTEPKNSVIDAEKLPSTAIPSQKVETVNGTSAPTNAPKTSSPQPSQFTSPIPKNNKD